MAILFLYQLFIKKFQVHHVVLIVIVFVQQYHYCTLGRHEYYTDGTVMKVWYIWTWTIERLEIPFPTDFRLCIKWMAIMGVFNAFTIRENLVKSHFPQQLASTALWILISENEAANFQESMKVATNDEKFDVKVMVI